MLAPPLFNVGELVKHTVGLPEFRLAIVLKREKFDFEDTWSYYVLNQATGTKVWLQEQYLVLAKPS